jgi:hypothetical protein
VFGNVILQNLQVLSLTLILICFFCSLHSLEQNTLSAPTGFLQILQLCSNLRFGCNLLLKLAEQEELQNLAFLVSF